MRWHIKARFHRRMTCRVLAVILAIGLIGFLYLSTLGVPRRFVNQWLGNLSSAGYRVTVERIRLDLMEGIVAENFQAFEDEDHLTPMLESDRVVLSLNPFKWLRHENGLRSLRIYNGLLRLGLVDQPAFKDADALVLRSVDGTVKFEADTWQLTELSADLLGLKINCSGLIHAVKSRRSAPAPLMPRTIPSARTPSASSSTANTATSTQTPDRTPVTRKLGALSRSQRERILELIKQLNAITFGIPPHADIEFQIYTDDPSASTAAIRMEGGGTRAFGARFDQWRLAADLSNGKLHLAEARLQRQDQRLQLSGSYSFTNRVVAARLCGQVTLMDWLSVIPRTARDELTASGLPMGCPIQYDIQVDSAPVAQALDHVHGRVQLAQTYVYPPLAAPEAHRVKGLWIEQCLAEFASTDGTLKLDPVYLVLGRGQTQGTLQGSLSYAFDSGDYEGQLSAAIDPHALLPFLSSNASDYVEALVFKGGPPRIDFDFSGRTNRSDAFWMSGCVEGSNFSYNAVPVTALGSRFNFGGGILSFEAIRLVPTWRSGSVEGSVGGWVTTDLDSTVIDFNILSTADPVAVTRLISTNIAEYLGDLRVAGTSRIAAQGRVDYDTGALTDVKAAIEGMRWIYPPFYIDRCSMNMAIRQSSVDLTDVRAEISEGRLSGKAYFYPDNDATSFRYAVNARADDVNLNTLMQMLGIKGSENCDGFIQGQCQLAGNIGPGRGDTAVGAGRVRIDNGWLYQMHMFGGLSRMVAILNPNFGNIEFSDFNANVTIKDRKFSTRDAVVSGPALIVHGGGLYAFDGGLNFVVWVQFQQHYQVLSRINHLTAPLAHLLAFRLTGTVADPKWWPLNLTKNQLLALPKELLITMPKDVLMGLPQELLVNLPRDVLITLPRELLFTLPQEILIKLPREILIDLPKELFIEIPKDTWHELAPQPPAKTKP